MAQSQPAAQPVGGFILLDSEPKAPDQISGKINLFVPHGLSKVADVVLAGNSKIENYAAGLKHYDGLRKGPNMELAPLADLYPSSIKPDFSPPAGLAGVSLDIGVFSLPEADLGVPVDSRALLGEGEKPAPAAAAPPAAAAAAAVTKPTKIKLTGAKPTKIKLSVKK